MKKMIFILFLFPLLLFGQKMDSLKRALKTADHDTLRCTILNAMIELEGDDHIWPIYNEQLKSIAEKNLASTTTFKNIYLAHFAYTLNNIGYLANSQGNIPKALEYFRKSLAIQEKVNDRHGMAESFNNIGAIYKKQEERKRAIDYYNRALEIYKEINDKDGIATAFNNLGSVYDGENNLDNALLYYKNTLAIRYELEDKSGIALAYSNIGFVYYRQGRNTEAIVSFQKSLKINEEAGDKIGIVNSLSNLSFALANNGKANEAFGYANRAFQISKEVGFPENIKNAAQALKRVFQKLNKYKEAAEMFELEIKLRDSIVNDVTKKAALKNQIQYEFEKKEAVANAEYKLELETQQAIAEEKQRRQKIIIGLVVLGLIAVIGFAVYVFKTLRLTRKQKLLIEIKNREVEEKQMEILDSIYYAQRIQRALIPSDKYIHKNLERLKKL